MLVLLAIVPSQRSTGAHPQTRGVKGATALAQLESLPLQGQSVISGALGAGAAAFAAERRAGVYRLAGGGVAADLTGRRVTVHVGGGTLSLALSGVGRGVRLAAVGRVSPTAHANRVTYRRAGVQEWYSAGPLGIEQGFTLTRRPAGTTGPLTLALRLDGSLHAQMAGPQVEFLASSGELLARYGGLAAVDAAGHRLTATLAVEGGRLSLRVDDRGARYPLRIDPLIQQGPKLTANDETGQGEFGYSMALSADGNTALIGGSSDNHLVGAAWVFTRSDGTWIQQGPKLTANDETGQGEFGGSVALSADGNTALIGGQIDNGVGAAWVFTRSDGTWIQQGPKLVANDEIGGYLGGAFGSGVALSADGSTALIGGQFDSNLMGAAWVFTRSGATWTQQGPKLTADDETGSVEAGGARLGQSVALSADGNIALIGGYGDNDFVGAAWVFTRSGETWTQQGPKLTANDQVGQGEFGWNVALSADGDTALIGGPFDNSGAGGAWVFTRPDTTWTQQGPKLAANDGTASADFGWSVSMSADGDTALIGGPFDNNYVGAAWVFTRSGATWTQQGAKLTANNEAGQGEFGYSVAVSADANATLIGGNRDNNYVGAAWAFSPLLVGSGQIQPNVDSNPAGTAEAFRYMAASTGSVSQLRVYLDSTSITTNVILGLYTNSSAGNPGLLLTSGMITNPKPGAWNTVTVPTTRVNAGTRYWLAVLAPFKAGTIKFRDQTDGMGGPTQTSAQRSLMSLPSSWKTGTHFANSPASLFAAP